MNLNDFVYFPSRAQAISLAAEAKRQEEKEKGVNPDSGGENPDIVPFEDNEEEEEEEEESEEEEEAFGQSVGVAAQGRERGRGTMWPPHIPLGRGARSISGMRGCPPIMVGADGFPYGPVTPDSFGMPDLFGMAPRGFSLYGPRFSGDFTGPASGMMFPGRPLQPGAMFPAGGFGMMMGPGRAPFMGAMGPAATNPLRGSRPGSMPFRPLPAPSSLSNRSVRRDQRAAANDQNDRHGVELDSVRATARGPDDETQHLQDGLKAPHEQFGAGHNFRNDESDSEDEAPRRSRDGEGKKKRRGLEGDATPGSDH